MTVGTPEVIALLEHYLELARTQRWGSVAIALTGHPGVADAHFAGDISLEASTYEALGRLQERVGNSIAAWRRPPQDDTLDASYVCYPVAYGPLGFDYLIWLIDAEMTRVREAAPGPLKVGFWLGKDAERRMHSDKRAMWLERVFRPCLDFIGAVEDERAIYGRCKEVFVPRDIVAACRAGERVPRLRTTASWDGPANPVTLTLREAAHGATRNSNVKAWIKFAKWLQSRGETVIVVRDTAKAMEPIDGVLTSPRASRSLPVRLALYEAAKVNIQGSNGPNGLALFGSKPCLLFQNPHGEDSDEAWNSPDRFEQWHGIKVGEQYPWCRPDQRYVWERDTFDNLVTAWTQTVAAIAA